MLWWRIKLLEFARVDDYCFDNLLGLWYIFTPRRILDLLNS